MSKSKKELIIYIVNMVTGTLLMITGIILATIKNSPTKLGFGLAIACIGSILLGMCIYGTVLSAKKVKKEKIQQ